MTYQIKTTVFQGAYFTSVYKPTYYGETEVGTIKPVIFYPSNFIERLLGITTNKKIEKATRIIEKRIKKYVEMNNKIPISQKE